METKMDFITKKGGIKRLLTMALGLIMAVIACVTVVPGTEMTVKAAGTGKNLQIGSAVLTPVMSDSYESTDRVSKNRVTTAQTVYYGSNGTQKWLVIGYNGTGAVSAANTATLFAIDNMETRKRYHAGRSNSYVNSDIRKLLIGESNENGEGGYYRDKFDNAEKTVILGRTLSQGGYGNPGSPDYIFSDGISDSSNPVDKLWLLSTKEADLLKQDYRRASNDWWLRSPGEFDYWAALTGYGEVIYAGIDVRALQDVRPAFNLNLQSIIFTSAAAGGKSSGNLGADALTAVADSGSNTEWKLTIEDSARNGFSAVTDSYDDATSVLTVNYSGALTGANEKISAIVKDSAGVVKYYGNVVDLNAPASTAGSATINLSGKYNAAAGDVVCIFNEQCNGNNMTDYSSALMQVSLTAGAPSVPVTPVAPAAPASEETNEEGNDIPESNYLDSLRDLLEYAVSLGGERTVYWRGGDALPSDIMKTLEENPQLTLIFSYTYEYKDYEVTIPGKKVKTDPKIPWYGPLYLYGKFGR